MKRLILLFFAFVWIGALSFGQGMPKILILNSQTGEPYQSLQDGFLKGLNDLGYVPDKKVEIKQFNLGNNPELVKRYWSENDPQSFAVIILNGTIALRGAKVLSFNDPKTKFLYACVTDPVGEGVIKDFKSAPFANFSGISYPVPVRERLRFLKTMFPKAKRIAYIYADMPQSLSYKAWLDEALKEAEFKDLTFNFIKVAFVPEDSGSQRMALLAKEEAEKIQDSIDLFLAPNDQLGAQKYFCIELAKIAKKPIVALGEADIRTKSGAIATIAPDLNQAGKRLAQMAVLILKGGTLTAIIPEWPPYRIIIDKAISTKMSIPIPDAILKSPTTVIVE